ncbi:MAG: FHA domain-containing protein [Chloroflexi bacterium]|nr:FHA domain-containing protein [Chloroflexota bacterium]
MVELIIQDAEQEIVRQTLTQGTHRLGRTQENSLVVPSNHLSRHHLQIEVTAEGVMVTDLGSTNGTNLRGRKLTPHTATSWPDNEALQIGPLTLRFTVTAPSRGRAPRRRYPYRHRRPHHLPRSPAIPLHPGPWFRHRRLRRPLRHTSFGGQH